MFFLLLLFQIVLIQSQENDLPEYEGIVIGNLRKRDQIPLYRFNRRWDQENLNYRRTKDIREDNYYDKRYQLPSSLEASVEASLEPGLANLSEFIPRKQIPLNLLNRKWNDVYLNNLRRFYFNKDADYLERGFEKYLQMSDLRKEEMFKEEAQEDLERLQRELKWFTITEEN